MRARILVAVFKFHRRFNSTLRSWRFLSSCGAWIWSHIIGRALNGSSGDNDVAWSGSHRRGPWCDLLLSAYSRQCIHELLSIANRMGWDAVCAMIRATCSHAKCKHSSPTRTAVHKWIFYKHVLALYCNETFCKTKSSLDWKAVGL